MMNVNASRPEDYSNEPHAPRSLGTVAAALATCAHPEDCHIGVTGGLSASSAAATWCGACGALRSQTAPEATWQSPALTSRLTKKHFEDIVLLLHAIGQSNLLAQAHPSPGAPGSPAHMHFRALRMSLLELSRLPLVREIDRLEEAIAEMPPPRLRP